MDIVVHGTKGGNDTFTPKKVSGLLDVNSDSSKASALGQEAFAIRFVENSIIFSKYKIIRDVRGGKRTGFLAFSLFLPNNKKLTGLDIISVLNKVSEAYCKKYIPENDNNLKYVSEDWAFLDRISDEYKARLRSVAADDIENLTSGTKDDAYIYYKGIEELQKYFDAPYQSEYSPYRQVLFVKEELRDKPENPLNALRHSDNPNDNLTGKIDLDKRAYALRDYDAKAKNGISIEIMVGGKLLYEKDKISNKDLISIRYFRKYFNDLVVKQGRLNDEWIRKYLLVDEENRKVDVEKNINLDPLKKTITFAIKDWEKNEVYGAKTFCKNAGGEMPIENYNQATFKGDELGKRWWVSANNDRFFSEERLIDFDKDCPGDTGNIDIVLNKHQLNKQQVIVLDENSGDNLNDFKLSKTEFTGSDIKETHRITVSCFSYESKTFTYCPAATFYLEPITLKKKQYGSGTKSINSGKGSPDIYGTFKRDKHVYQLEKNEPFNKKSKSIAGAIVGFLIIFISVGIWFMNDEKNEVAFEQPQQNNYQYIQAYIKGDSLILDTLTSYKEAIGKGPTEILKILDSAIKKRKAVDSLDFSEIKTFEYYQSQNKFISAIREIDSSQYKVFKNKLVDVSSWSLDRIADSINVILNRTKATIEKKQEIKEDVQEEQKENNNVKDSKNKTDQQKSEQKRKEKENQSKNEIKNQTKPEQTPAGKAIMPPRRLDKTTEIIQYLKGDELKKDILNNYLKEAGNNATLKKSIRLCLSLWSLNGQKNNDYCTIHATCEEDNNLKGTTLTRILNTLCKKTDVNYAGLSSATDILSKLKAKK